MGEEEYAELVSWHDRPEAYTWLNEHRHMQPGEGLLVLESQQRTLQFLVASVKLILHDMEESQLLAGPLQEVLASVTENDTGLASLATLAAERPYRVPSQVETSRIVSLLAATRDAAEDHMWALREDPSYFAHTMTASFNHRQELVKDYRGKLHPLFDARREDLLWGRVISEETTLAFIRLEEWTSLHQQAAEMHRLHQKYASDLNPDKDLPEEYLMQILRFRLQLQRFAQGPMVQLKVSLIASEPWRPYFDRLPESNPAATDNLVVSRPDAASRLGAARWWLFDMLQGIWNDDQAQYLTRLATLMDEVQRIIDSEPDVKNSITAYVAVQISDLSILCECLHQLHSFQPSANMYEDQLFSRQDQIEQEFRKQTAPWARLLNATKGSNDVLARHGTPNGSKFHYPVSKRRNRDNVDAMRDAEQSLDAFWMKVDELVHRNAGDLTGTAIREFMTQPRILQRTPEWTEPEKTNGRLEAVSKVHTAWKPLSEVYFDLEHRTERTTKASSEVQQPKSKAKTRGLPSAGAVPITEDQAMAEANPVDPQPTLFVDNRALKVFKTLFYIPSAGATPGEVAWADFLHAMVQTGFRAEKLYGSVWQFSPSKLDVERSIQFHEPHPTGKIPYWIARRHGRRLNRAYGWFAGMFEVARKGE